MQHLENMAKMKFEMDRLEKEQTVRIVYFVFLTLLITLCCLVGINALWIRSSTGRKDKTNRT